MAPFGFIVTDPTKLEEGNVMFSQMSDVHGGGGYPWSHVLSKGYHWSHVLSSGGHLWYQVPPSRLRMGLGVGMSRPSACLLCGYVQGMYLPPPGNIRVGTMVGKLALRILLSYFLL